MESENFSHIKTIRTWGELEKLQSSSHARHKLFYYGDMLHRLDDVRMHVFKLLYFKLHPMFQFVHVDSSKVGKDEVFRQHGSFYTWSFYNKEEYKKIESLNDEYFSNLSIEGVQPGKVLDLARKIRKAGHPYYEFIDINFFRYYRLGKLLVFYTENPHGPENRTH
jgi:hypothetical protein